jgi:Mg-chelatase subunit ChlD
MSALTSLMLTTLAVFSSVGWAQRPRCLTDIMIIMDNSGSVQDVFEDEKEIAARVVEQLNVSPSETRIAYMEFSNEPRKVFGFNDFIDKDSVSNQLRALRQLGGSTNTAAAMRLADADFDQNARHKVNRMILLVTDGHSLNTVEEIRSAYKQLESHNVMVWIASASDDPDLFEFRMWTGDEGDQQFLRNNVTKMPEAMARFIIGGGCLPREKPSIEVIKPTPEVLTCQIDMVFVIDNSESVDLVFNKEKDEAVQLIESLDVGPQNVRLAVIQYNDDVQLIQDFEPLHSKRETVEVILSIPQIGGNTNTLGGLQMAASSFARFGRPDARKMIILITDGHSMNRWDDLEAQVQTMLKEKIQIYLATASDDIGTEEFSMLVDNNFNRLFLKHNVTSLIPAVHKLIPASGCASGFNARARRRVINLL